MQKEDQLRQQIANKLKATRTLKGITQAEIAEQVGIDNTHYSRLERGVSNPSLFVAYRICQALGISLDELFDN